MKPFSFEKLLDLITGNHGLPAKAGTRVKRVDGEEELAPTDDGAPTDAGQTLTDIGVSAGEPIQLAQALGGLGLAAAGGSSSSGSTTAIPADNQWNSVAIATANSDTSLSVTGLQAGVYKLYTVDAAGNLSPSPARPPW